MLALTLALSVLIGVALGLFGGGGSILTVPILLYASGMGAHEAIATSLLVVGVTSAAAVVAHARAGRVRWRTGLVFGGASMVGAYAGGRAGALVPEVWLLVAFAAMMLATAAAMIRGRREPLASPRSEVPFALALAEGAVVGLVTGMVGAGGGFLIVPALVLLGGLPMSVAVGTSLLVITMKSAAGLLGYLHSVEINWALAAGVTAAAVIGSLVGGRLAARISDRSLRKGFGWFVLAMGVFVLAEQVPTDLRSALLTSPLTWAGAATVGAVAVFTMHRRRARPRLSRRSPRDLHLDLGLVAADLHFQGEANLVGNGDPELSAIADE